MILNLECQSSTWHGVWQLSTPYIGMLLSKQMAASMGIETYPSGNNWKNHQIICEEISRCEEFYRCYTK